MHRDRNNGTWPELKAKRHDKFDHSTFDDEPLHSLDVMPNRYGDDARDIQQVKKDRAAKQLADVKNMFKNMVDYDDIHNKPI